MNAELLPFVVGWNSILLGAISGALMGLFFAQEEWSGGYGSFRRRMLRLGHISFFGIGFLNLLFGLTLNVIPMPAAFITVGAVAFLVAAIAMPSCCFLTAWNKACRHLFPIPVIAVFSGIGSILMGLASS